MKPNKLELQELLIKLDLAKNKKEKEKIVEKITEKYLPTNYWETKPAELFDANRETSIRDGDAEHYDNSLDLSEHFSLKKNLSMVQTKKEFSHIGQLHRSLLDEVDYSKIRDIDFETFLSGCNYLSEISAKSFIKRYGALLKTKFKDNKWYTPNYDIYDKLTLQQLEDLGYYCSQLKKNNVYLAKSFGK
jgi:hypothetical protein